MYNQTFAELFSAAVEAHSCSLRQLAEWLSARGLPIHRSTLSRWRKGDSRPGSDNLALLQRLPDAMGLSPNEAARFMRGVGKALGLAHGWGGADDHPPGAIPRRAHFGADDLPPFAGRAGALAELQGFVLRRQSVLITGTGGVGKTRLAQELLRTCGEDFGHGCDFLSLGPDQEGAQVIRNAARLLGMEFSLPEVASTNRRLALGRLREHVRGIDLLFLVDGVVEASQVRDLVWELPGVTWVFTARRVGLKRMGVHALHLRLPATVEAAAIFRAHLPAATVPDGDDDRLVCRVVDKVGGLPFALRLAAAVVGNRQAATVAELDAWLDAGGLGRGGSPTKKLERLFDSMLAGVPTASRWTLLLCGAFPTPTIRLSAVQAVGETAGARPTPDDWAALEDYSLVDFPDDAHVALHARLHEHMGKRLLAESGYPAVRAAFAAHYLALAESVTLGVAETERDYRPLIGEEPNLLAAAEVLRDAGNWSDVQRLWPGVSGCLWTAGDRRGYEAFDRLCLAAARSMGDEAWAARLLSEIGYVALEDGEWAAAEALFVESQTYCDGAAGRALDQARLRRYRAQAVLGRGDSERALVLLAEAERLLVEAAGDGNMTLARMLLYSARMTVHHRRGDLVAAEAAGRHAERLHRQRTAAAAPPTYADFLVELGDILFYLGRPDEASERWAELVAGRGDLPHLPQHAEAQMRLAWVAAEQGAGGASELAGAARQTLERHGQLARAAQAIELIEAMAAGSALPGFDVLFAS